MEILKEIDKLQGEINRFRPLDKKLLKQIREYYRVGVTYSSNALEGNSLTESETKIVLEEGITIGGKSLKEHFEAIGHAEAFDYLHLLTKKKEVTEEAIKKLHRLFYHKIDENQAGKYRNTRAFVTGSKYPLPSPRQISGLMKNLILKIKRLRKEKHPVETAAIAHKEFVFIHPFVDGNGRVARLLMNLFLLQDGYTVAIIPPVVRSEYIQTLEKAHVDDSGFMNFIAVRVKETQKDYLRLFK
ncbi:MAG: Fic family protein [Candidatus Omnitrophota bacterium]